MEGEEIRADVAQQVVVNKRKMCIPVLGRNDKQKGKVGKSTCHSGKAPEMFGIQVLQFQKREIFYPVLCPRMFLSALLQRSLSCEYVCLVKDSI